MKIQQEANQQNLYQTDYYLWLETTLAQLQKQDYGSIDGDAVKQDSAETGLPEEEFPPQCPYAVSAVLDADFFPE